jgi:ABC-2 type transport system ATP-binding protein
MVEVPYSYPNLNVYENLDIIRRMRKLKDKKSINRIIDLLELEQYAKKPAKNLSLGNAQRLGLAKALIHQPEILILDEPTNGLDPAGILSIREMLIDLARNKGVSIFISSHILGEIAKFAHRIGIVQQGKLIEEINQQQLQAYSNKLLCIKASNIQAAYKTISNAGYCQLELTKNSITIKDEKALKQPEEIATLLVNNGNPPSELAIQEENLESYFLRTIKENNKKYTEI